MYGDFPFHPPPIEIADVEENKRKEVHSSLRATWEKGLSEQWAVMM